MNLIYFIFDLFIINQLFILLSLHYVHVFPKALIFLISIVALADIAAFLLENDLARESFLVL